MLTGCLDNIHNLCEGEEFNAKCVKYQKEPPKISKLKGTCNSVHSIVTDIYDILSEGFDYSGLGERCLKYGAKINLNSVLKVHEQEICDIKQQIKEKNIGSICAMSITDCGLDLTGLVDKCTGMPPSTLGELLQILISKSK